MKKTQGSFVVALLVAFAPFAAAQKKEDPPPPSIEEVMAQAAAARRGYSARPNSQQVDSISVQKVKDALIGKLSEKGWRLSKEGEHLLRFEPPTTNHEDTPIFEAEILLYPKDTGVTVKFAFFGDRNTTWNSDVLNAKIDVLQSLDDLSKPVAPSAK